MNYRDLFVRSFVVASALGFATVAAAAWVPAPANPPQNNVLPPINESTTGQTKAGALIVNTVGATNGLVVAAGHLVVSSGNVGIGVTPTSKLHVAGAGVFTSSVTAASLSISGSATFGGSGAFTSSVSASAFTYSSDRRLKKNIEPISGAVAKVLRLNGVTFNWRDSGKHDIGLIAQEVEAVVPELVHTDAEGYKAVDYARVVPLLVEAIKQQQRDIEVLTAAVKLLQEKE